MDIAATIKRAPRWAWVTAAGVGIGAAGIKLWTNRAKDSTPSTATDPTTVDGYPAPTNTSNPIATIVPPVIIGSQVADANAGVGQLQDLYVGAVANLISSYQDVWGPVQTAQIGLLANQAETLSALALAGSPPNSQTLQPAAITPYPAPAPSAPIALPTATPARKPCGGCKAPYPYCNEATGKCYTVACANGKGERRKGKWHLYPPGTPDVFVSPTC